jgi:integrase
MITIVIRKIERKKKTVLYLDVHCEGRRWYERLDIFLTGNKKADAETMNEAERLRAERHIQLSSGFDVTVKNKNFLDYYKKVKDERPEYERRAGVYKHLVNYSQAKKLHLTFRNINESFWNGFKAYLVEVADHKPYTIHTVLSILKAVLNRAVREKLLLSNPLQHVKEKRPKTTRTYLTLEEVKKLKAAPCGNDEIKRAFLFSCNTGLRISDIENLKKKDLARGEINITIKKTKDSLTIPYDINILRYIPGFNEKTDDDYLFHLPARSIISPVFKAWIKTAEINKNITFHSARHTFATLHLTYGTAVEVLRDLLGHRDVRETQIYAKIISEKKKEALKNLPEI